MTSHTYRAFITAVAITWGAAVVPEIVMMQSSRPVGAKGVSDHVNPIRFDGESLVTLMESEESAGRDRPDTGFNSKQRPARLPL